MKRIANVLIYFTLTLLLTTSITAQAGILESIDKEITDLVKTAEPFLVTVEAKNRHYNKLFIGSGILIDRDGYILTTSSIADSNEEITIKFKDGDSCPADIIGIDRESNAALLKIKPVDRQTPKFGDPDKLRDGSWITVISNSYDIPTSVSFGIFSGITDDGLLQLSTQSYPGSAGGAVFNAKGELIGMLIAQTTETTSLLLPYENYMNFKIKDDIPSMLTANNKLSIDIPSNNASIAIGIDKINRIVDHLKKFGKVKHGFLGIVQTELPKKIKRKYDLDGGVLVTEVIRNSPADKAGFLENDIIIKVEDKLVKCTGYLYGFINSCIPGEKVKFEIIRNDSKMTITATLGEAMNNSFEKYYNNHKRFNADSDIWTGITKNFEDNLVDLHKYLDKIKKQNRFPASEDIDDLEINLKDLEVQLEKLSDKIANLYKKLEKK